MAIRHRQQRPSASLEDDSETITISRAEYEVLMANQRRPANDGIDSYGTVIAVIILILLFTSVYVLSTLNKDETVAAVQYWDRELERAAAATMPVVGRIRNNNRQGRIYHRGGNYGRA